LLTSITNSPHEPLTSYLGSVCTIRGITVCFTNVPLDGKKGLEKEESLFLLVREVKIIGSRGEPAFRMDVKDNKGVQKRGDFMSPHNDPAIGRWVNGLRTGNGLVASSSMRGMGRKLSISL
jgi:hypothetical protein